MRITVAACIAASNLLGFVCLDAIAEPESPIRKLDWKARADIPLPEGPGCLTSVVFMPDSNTLIAAAGNTVRLINLKTGRKEHEFECGPGVALTNIALTPNGQLLAVVGGGQKGIVLWDVLKKKESRRLPGNRVNVDAVTFSPDGKTLISSGREKPRAKKVFAPPDYGIRLWNVETGEELKSYGGGLEGISVGAISPDGKSLAVGDYSGKITIIDIASGKELRVLLDDKSSQGITALAFSPDGKLLASANGSSVSIFDPGSDGLKSRLTRSKHAEGNVTTDLCFTPNGAILATGSMDTGSIVFWHVASKKELGTLETERGDTNAIAISPDGKWLASSGYGATIKLWELRENKDK